MRRGLRGGTWRQVFGALALIHVREEGRPRDVHRVHLIDDDVGRRLERKQFILLLGLLLLDADHQKLVSAKSKN